MDNRFSDAMNGAEFVLVDGVVFRADYLRVPDETTVPDDVVLEATHGDAEIEFTRRDIDGAEFVGGGVYRLRSGSLVKFLCSATVH